MRKSAKKVKKGLDFFNRLEYSTTIESEYGKVKDKGSQIGEYPFFMRIQAPGSQIKERKGSIIL